MQPTDSSHCKRPTQPFESSQPTLIPEIGFKTFNAENVVCCSRVVVAGKRVPRALQAAKCGHATTKRTDKGEKGRRLSSVV